MKFLREISKAVKPCSALATKKCWLIVFGALFWGCTIEEVRDLDKKSFVHEDELTEYEISVMEQVFNDNHQISKEEAQKEIENMLFVFQENSEFPISRAIESIETILVDDEIKKDYVGISLPDTLAYIFNFKENQGYAIFAADKRVAEPILCFVEQGTLAEATDNPGLYLFLEQAENKIVEQIDFAQQKRDSLADVISYKLDKLYTDFDDYDSEVEVNEEKGLFGFGSKKKRIYSVVRMEVGSWQVITKREPLVPIEWGQGSPFNALVKYKSNCTDAPVGCVATATAQIMAYWQYPWEIDGQSIYWNELVKYTGETSFKLRGYLNPSWKDEIENANQVIKANVAHLMERVGYHVSMKYGCSASSASISDATAFLRNRGYQGGFRNDYEINIVVNSLNSSHPLILEGCAIKKKKKFLGIKGKSSYSDCHAWVVDGYKNFGRKIKQITEIRDKRTNRLIDIRTDYFYQYFKEFHNNWGWDGSANGWFQAGVFDAGSYNFQYRNRIYPHIRRYKY